ncbi:HTH_Tnp_Tc3_2 domain-containing protein [Trichonephila clavipes]|nr:HTH_Tnp_Tc3_2 domain-containing protein [Trichonephila clavipes]
MSECMCAYGIGFCRSRGPQSRTNHRRGTHGPFNSRNRQSARIFDSVKSIPIIHGRWTKTSDRTNCKGQSVLTVHGERQLRRILRTQGSQAFAQITTQLKDSARRSVSKWTVQRSLHGFREPSTYDNTFAQCSSLGSTSCLGKRTQILECGGLEMSSME